MSEDLLKILQIIGIVFPHIARMIDVAKHPDGSLDVNIHVDAADAKLHEGIDAVLKWRADNP
jgi:hypothetical protein